MKRQPIRKLVLLVSLLLFPVTMWYFSPAIIIMGMAEHILTGSFFVFLLMLILSMFLGRSFCGYLCPAGGLQECVAGVNGKPAKQGKRRAIKYVIWTVWIAVIVISFISGEGTLHVDVFYMTDHGVSVTEIANYLVYYAVILLLILPPLIYGRRAACHYICWMVPFMVIGEKIGQMLHIPQLHVSADNRKCISCKKCETVCPMGLRVEQMIRENIIIVNAAVVFSAVLALTVVRKMCCHIHGKRKGGFDCYERSGCLLFVGREHQAGCRAHCGKTTCRYSSTPDS